MKKIILIFAVVFIASLSFAEGTAKKNIKQDKQGCFEINLGELLSSLNSDGPVHEYYVCANHRKFYCTVVIDSDGMVSLYMRAKKKFFGSWKSYKTRFYMQVEGSGTIFLGEHKSGCTLPIGYLDHADPVHGYRHLPLGTKIKVWSGGVGEDAAGYLVI